MQHTIAGASVLMIRRIRVLEEAKTMTREAKDTDKPPNWTRMMKNSYLDIPFLLVPSLGSRKRRGRRGQAVRAGSDRNSWASSLIPRAPFLNIRRTPLPSSVCTVFPPSSPFFLGLRDNSNWRQHKYPTGARNPHLLSIALSWCCQRAKPASS